MPQLTPPVMMKLSAAQEPPGRPAALRPNYRVFREGEQRQIEYARCSRSEQADHNTALRAVPIGE
jgi:hypothetical protein